MNREKFEKLPEIIKIMNEYGIDFMNHSGRYEAREFKDFEFEQFVNGAWYVWKEQQKKIDAVIAIVDDENLGLDARLGEFYTDITEVLR